MTENKLTNKEIISVIDTYAKLLELHEENPFKVKSFKNASFTLSKIEIELANANAEELTNINGIGKSLSAKIIELNESGSIIELEKLLEKTPLGVLELLKIKGLGPSKIRSIWRELEITSPGELLYACYENRLSTLKGFGAKTQEKVIQNLEFMQKNASFFRISDAHKLAQFIEKELSNSEEFRFVGEYLRAEQVLKSLEILVLEGSKSAVFLENLKINSEADGEIPLKLFYTTKEEFEYEFFKLSCENKFLKNINFEKLEKNQYTSENHIFEALNIPYIIPERRIDFYENQVLNKLTSEAVELKDLKGLLHLHTKYSDGQNSLEEMLLAAKKLGYEYMGVSDHSKSAFYANGLNEERILQQHEEIDSLNLKYPNFKIFKSIESDIINDGNLDYSNEVLSSFDFVIASIHSNLSMDENKAKLRLTKAIENPYTTILGHPTGRLLLSRKGYPVDHKYLIEACAKNNVAIELNANPYRLDLDWKYINLALENGVKISINPDAHSLKGIEDNYYGVAVARKSLLEKSMLLNNMTSEEISNYFKKK